MTAPNKIWADWTPFDDETMPATLSCYTPKSNGTAEYTRVEYIRADLVAAPNTRVVTVDQLRKWAATVKTYTQDYTIDELGDDIFTLGEIRAVIRGQDNE
jgi:hypothetical protein